MQHSYSSIGSPIDNSKRFGIAYFHRIRNQCEQGSREAWQAFLSYYTPVVFKLLEIYWPSGPERHKELWQEVLRAIGANSFERLRALSRQAELEFLVDLRAFVFERAAAQPGARSESGEAAGPTREAVHALLEGCRCFTRRSCF